MRVFVLLVLVFCVDSSFQQLNRQQNQIHNLAYAESDFNPLPPIVRTTTTTTTEIPESTTKKKGFFSGITGFFKFKDKESTTTEQPTTTTKSVATTSTTTVKALVATTTIKSPLPNAVVTPSTTPKLPSRADSPTPPPRPQQPLKPESPTPPPRPQSSLFPEAPQRPAPPPPPPRSQQPNQQQSTSTASPKKTTKDEFPALPTQSTNRPGVLTSTVAPKKTAKDEFPALPTQTNKPAASYPTLPPLSVPNAWGKPPGVVSGPTQKPQSFFPQSSSTTTKPVTSSVTTGPVTDSELLTLSESLFSKDIHNAFKYVTVDYQGRTQFSSTTDEAPQPFLKIDEKLNSVNTVEKMKLMYNNYEQDTSINEYVSPIERREEDDFLEAVLATPVMRHAMNFLTHKTVVTADPQTHRELLKTIWFNLYSRGMGKISSSGFEHVFLSEVKNGTVMGLHNWIYMSEAEKAGDLNYKGWSKKIDLGNKGQIAKVRFSLNGLEKPSNSLFIGTSPELELALYTVCFELRGKDDKDCRMSYGGKDFNIITHSYRYRGKNLIGSAYPEI